MIKIILRNKMDYIKNTLIYFATIILISITFMFIIFMLRESILIYSDKTILLETKIVYIVLYIVLGFLMIFSLFYFRKLSILNSPQEKCSKCEEKIENVDKISKNKH